MIMSELDNLLLNLSSGMPVSNLQPSEIAILEKALGADWRYEIEGHRFNAIMDKVYGTE